MKITKRTDTTIQLVYDAALTKGEFKAHIEQTLMEQTGYTWEVLHYEEKAITRRSQVEVWCKEKNETWRGRLETLLHGKKSCKLFKA